MSYTDLIGIAAGCLTTLSLVPQATKIWRSKSAKDVSLRMFATFSLGVALWLVYGFAIGEVPLVLTNAVTLALALVIVAMKIKFG